MGYVLTAATNIHDEILQQEFSFCTVVHFRVELDPVSLFSFDVISGDFHITGAADDLKVIRNGLDGVTVRHPYLAVVRNVVQQRMVAVYER